ncbi:hypothetical protein Droror1_Dr00012004, partial [Drosera rotundifolia]
VRSEGAEGEIDGKVGADSDPLWSDLKFLVVAFVFADFSPNCSLTATNLRHLPCTAFYRHGLSPVGVGGADSGLEGSTRFDGSEEGPTEETTNFISSHVLI